MFGFPADDKASAAAGSANVFDVLAFSSALPEHLFSYPAAIFSRLQSNDGQQPPQSARATTADDQFATHLLRCQDTTSGRVLRSMGHNYGRDNVKKRVARRKKSERLALAKKNKKKTAK